MRSRSPHSLNRRNFLRGGIGGLGGLAGLGALGLAASEQTRIAEAAGIGQPRFVFIYSPCGRHDSWRTNTPGTNYKLGPTMEMFEPWKSHTTIMDGLTTARFSYKLNSHWGGAHCLLGGKDPMDYGKVPEEPANMSSGSQRTIDHLLADNIGKDTPVRNIVLGGLDNNNEQRGLDLSYTAQDKPQRAIHEADLLFTALFGEGGVSQMPPPTQDDGVARQRLKQWEQEVLGLGKLQSAQLRSRVGRQELVYLEQYEQNLNEAFQRVVETDPTAARIPVSASCSNLKVDIIEDGGKSEELNARHHDTQLSTLAAALACGRTRVGVAVMAGIRDQMRVNGSDRRHHSHCHDSPCDDHYLLFDHYYGKRVSKFLEQLASYPEGDGTVLDNTIIVWSSEISYKATDHHHAYHPVHLFGGLPGNKLKMGQYVKVPYYEARKQHALDDPRNRRLPEVYLTIAQALNIDLGDFADPMYVKEPFSELLA